MVSRVDAAVPSSPCLITGAGGFIGARLFERMQASQALQHRPVALLRGSGAAGFTADREVRHADLLQRAQVLKVLEGMQDVVHLAHGPRGPELTRILVEAAIARRVRRFVHISTMSVHGPTPGPDAAREATATIGRYGQDYCDSKAEQEEIVRSAVDRGDLEAVILRPTVVYGPGSAFVEQILQQAQSGTVTWFDEGVGVCNAVHVDDVCDAITCALQSPEAVGESLFVNGDERVSWRAFIESFALAVQPPPRFINLRSDDALAYWAAHPPVATQGLCSRVTRKIRRLIGRAPEPAPWPPLTRVQRETIGVFFSNQRARERLGWAPRIGLAEGVQLTLAALRARGALR